jgi:foldase protein PrsA
MRISKKLAALGAFFVVVAVVIAGCGGSSNSVGSNSVANVAGNAVSKRAWQHWMFVYAKQESAQYAEEGETEPIVVPDPPNFEQCQKDLKTSASFASATSALLKRDCAEIFQTSNKTILTFLLQGYWYQGLAHKEGINITDAQVNAKLAAEIKQEFKTKAAEAAYFKSSGETRADLQWQLRAQLAYQKLLKKYTTTASAAEVSGYYSENPSKFTTPELRDAHVLRVTSKAKADAAYQALKSGSSWDSVTKQYESGSTSSNTGALLQNITDGSSSTLEQAAAKAVFANKVGTLAAPIKGVYGYYVIEVTKVTPAKKQPFNAKTKKQIQSTLATAAQTKAKATVAKMAEKEFGSRTKCADGFAVQTYCANYASAKPAALPAAPSSSTGSGSSSSGSSSSGSSGSSTSTSSGSGSSSGSSNSKSSGKSKKK